MTLALSTSHTRPWRFCASSQATRTTRSISCLGIDLGIDAAPGAVGHRLDPARVAEIDAAGQFAHDHQIEAGDQLALQARRVGERLEHHRRAQIGEQIHFLAQAQEAALGAQLERQGLPFRAADRAEQHGVAGQRLVERAIGQRHAVGVVGGTADQPLGDFEAGDMAAIEKFGDAQDLAHDLRADAVAGQDQNLAVGARCPRHASGPALGHARLPRARQIRLFLVAGDFGTLLLGQADVVKPVQEAMLAKGAELELRPFHRPGE